MVSRANARRQRVPGASKDGRRIRLHFLGAAREVTGSLHFFEFTYNSKTVRFFLDMGLNQQNESINKQNRLPKGMKPQDVDFGIFSHAHIDHTGYFPKLVKDGFAGPAYATPATIQLMHLLLPDSGHLQEEAAERRNTRARQEALKGKAASKDKRAVQDTGTAKGKKPTAREKVRPAPQLVQALYNQAEAEASLKHLHGVEFGVIKQVAPGVQLQFSNASHILGAAVVKLTFGEGGNKRTVVFTGDLGRPSVPVLKDVECVRNADYIISESTYGDRCHDRSDRKERLAEIVNAGYERAKKPNGKYGHGIIVMPAFAVGRAQSLLYDLRELMDEKRIPEMMTFLDSPMSIKATEIYRRNSHLFNDKTKKLVDCGVDPFRTPRFMEVVEYAHSEKLDSPAAEPVIVVGSSGMAVGGRILRHLERRLPGENNTVVFVGFQGDGTLGRQLTSPDVDEVRIGGKPVKVRAKVEQLHQYSGHADYVDILAWLSGFKNKPKRVFLVHGDQEACDSLATRIKTRFRWDVEIPHYRQYVDLE